VIVISAIPVQPAGSCRPEPGSTGAGVAVLVVDVSEMSLPAVTDEPAAALSAGDPVAEGEADSADEAATPEDGVDDDAGLSPVI
jgi:hypothetical protein